MTKRILIAGLIGWLALGSATEIAQAQNRVVVGNSFRPWGGWGGYNPLQTGYYPYPSYSPSVFNNPYYSGATGSYGYGRSLGGMSIGAAGYSGPIYIPGWSASSGGDTSARARDSVFPAVAVAADSSLLSVGTLSLEPRAQLVITVPSGDAEVRIDGVLTTQTGTVRRLATPVLQGMGEYVYEISARWPEGSCPGRPSSETRTVTFRAGQVVPVDFSK